MAHEQVRQNFSSSHPSALIRHIRATLKSPGNKQIFPKPMNHPLAREPNKSKKLYSRKESRRLRHGKSVPKLPCAHNKKKGRRKLSRDYQKKKKKKQQQNCATRASNGQRERESAAAARKKKGISLSSEATFGVALRAAATSVCAACRVFAREACVAAHV